MKRIILISIFSFALFTCYSQSAFKSLPKPHHGFGLEATSVPTKMTAYRFTAPFAGFMYPQNQVVTGMGFGINKLHYIDSTEKWYTDVSFNGVIYAGGNTTPSLRENNIISLGLSLGVLNQLIMIGGAYNLPTNLKPKGSFGVVLNLAVPLN